MLTFMAGLLFLCVTGSLLLYAEAFENQCKMSLLAAALLSISTLSLAFGIGHEKAQYDIARGKVVCALDEFAEMKCEEKENE